MLNVCIHCKKYSAEKEIIEEGKFQRCPFCGHKQAITRWPLFIITGASAAGKSTISAQLFLHERDYHVIESDIFWSDYFNEPETDYRKYREYCLRICKNISQIGKPVVLCGSAVPKQFENCTERRYFSEIHYLAVVCNEDILVRRLTEQRHIEDQDLIARSIDFNHWLKENATKTTPQIQLLDNSHLTVEEATRKTSEWIYKHLLNTEPSH